MATASIASQDSSLSHRRRRAPEEGVLYRVLAEHLETFLDRAGDRLPGFIAKELRKYLHCGILAAGFAMAPYRSKRMVSRMGLDNWLSTLLMPRTREMYPGKRALLEEWTAFVSQ